MVLTLAQIRKVIREEIGNEAKSMKNRFDSKLLDLRMRIVEEVWEVRDRTKNLEIAVTQIKMDVQEVKKDIKKIDKKLDHQITHLDNHFTKRINKLEEQVNLPAQL